MFQANFLDDSTSAVHQEAPKTVTGNRVYGLYKGMSMRDLVSKVQYEKTMAQDYLVDTRQMSVDTSGRPAIFIADRGDFPMSTHCMGQLRSYLKIPASYSSMLLEKKPDLLATNINTLLPIDPTSRMIRTLNGQARAFLSDRYKIISNYDVALMAVQTLQGMADEGHAFQMASCDVTPSKLYLKVVFPMTQRDVTTGDAVQFGCIISNSEIGGGRCTVQGFVLRLVCDNGMVQPERGMKATHLGPKIAQEDGQYVSNVYQNDTKEADIKLLMLRLRDHIRATVSETEIHASLSAMKRAANSSTASKPIEAVKVLAKEIDITSEEGETVLEQFLRQGDYSQWGMVNALTETAKRTPDGYDRATHLELMGGKVLDFSDKRWRSIAEAV